MEEKFSQRPYEMSPYNSSDENGSGPLEIERNPMPSSEEEEEGAFAEDDRRQFDQLEYFQNQHPTFLQNRRQSQRDRSFIPPRVNCPEKIIVCLDVSSEMDSNHFRLGDGSSYSPLMMTRRIIEIFVQSKHRMDKRHEFSLILLRETALWVKDFMNDPKKIIDALDDINDTFNCEFLHLTSLFDIIAEKVNLPIVEKPDSCPPPYVIRVILLCGRSQYVPQLSCLAESYKKLTHSEYFFIDMFYLHEPPNEDNKCEEIFDLLCGLDERGTSYIFEVSRNPTRLHDCMAKLLAHPLQRPLQKDTYYKLMAPAHR